MKNKDYYKLIAYVISRHNNMGALTEEFSILLTKFDPNFRVEKFLEMVNQYRSIRDLKKFVDASTKEGVKAVC